MGQSAHPGRPGRWSSAVLAVAVLVGAPVLTGCSSSVAAATTVLRGVAGVTVVHADGTALTGTDGLRLRRGDVVRTDPSGRVELVTRDRVVYVGSDAAVQVADGARQVLRHGAVVVDAQRGAGLQMQVASLALTVAPGTAVRAERSVTVRVGALAGAVDLTSSTGRTLEVPALHQTVVGGDALPDATTPLRLTDDDGEARTVPDLVRDDRTLLGLARGIDSTGRSTVRVIEASSPAPLTAPPGVGRSERLLPAVIAAAGPDGDTGQRYRSAVSYRKAGGSWAVVARLVGVRASGVVAALAAFERTQPGGHIGSVREVLAAVSAAGPDRGPAGPAGDGSGSSGGGDHDSTGGGGGNPTPSPSPSSSSLLDTVDDAVNTVIGLVPTPSPSPSGSSAAGSLLPLPQVSLPTLPQVP